MLLQKDRVKPGPRDSCIEISSQKLLSSSSSGWLSKEWMAFLITTFNDDGSAPSVLVRLLPTVALSQLYLDGQKSQPFDNSPYVGDSLIVIKLVSKLIKRSFICLE